jgi:hypothetical protein
VSVAPTSFFVSTRTSCLVGRFRRPLRSVGAPVDGTAEKRCSRPGGSMTERGGCKNCFVCGLVGGALVFGSA